MKFKVGQEVRIKRPEHPHVQRPYAGRRAVIRDTVKYKGRPREYGLHVRAFSAPHLKWYAEWELEAIA